MSLDDCLAVPEISEYLRVAVSTAHELLRAGELIEVKAKGTTRTWCISHVAISGFATRGLFTRRVPLGARKTKGAGSEN